MNALDVVRTLVALSITCWLAMVLPRLVARGRGFSGTGVKLKGGVNLGHGRGVWMVEALGKEYLLGVTEHEITVLAEGPVQPGEAGGFQAAPDGIFAASLRQALRFARERRSVADGSHN